VPYRRNDSLSQLEHVNRFTKFSLGSDLIIAEGEISDFFSKYTHYTDLRISHPEITGAHLDFIAQQCPHLKSLSLLIFDASLVITETFSSLKTLEVGLNFGTRSYSADMLPHAPLLEELYICNKNFKGTLSILKNSRRYPNVHTVKIDLCFCSTSSACDCLPDLCQAFPKLNTLVLNMCQSSQKEAILRLIKGFGSLKFLKITGKNTIGTTTSVMTHVMDRTLFDDELLEALANHHPGLQYLRLRGLDYERVINFNITDVGLAHLANNCHQLKQISLCGTHSGDITTQGVIYLAQGCPALRELELPTRLESEARELFRQMYPHYVRLF
jgi:hypothetical protein